MRSRVDGDVIDPSTDTPRRKSAYITLHVGDHYQADHPVVLRWPSYFEPLPTPPEPAAAKLERIRATLDEP